MPTIINLSEKVFVEANEATSLISRRNVVLGVDSEAYWLSFVVKDYIVRIFHIKFGSRNWLEYEPLFYYSRQKEKKGTD